MEKIITFIIIALSFYLLLKIISAPIKLFFKFALNTILGLLMLFIVNLIGSNFGFTVNISVLNCLITGILGIPGVILMVLIKILL